MAQVGVFKFGSIGSPCCSCGGGGGPGPLPCTSACNLTGYTSLTCTLSGCNTTNVNCMNSPTQPCPMPASATFSMNGSVGTGWTLVDSSGNTGFSPCCGPINGADCAVYPIGACQGNYQMLLSCYNSGPGVFQPRLQTTTGPPPTNICDTSGIGTGTVWTLTSYRCSPLMLVFTSPVLAGPSSCVGFWSCTTVTIIP